MSMDDLVKAIEFEANYPAGVKKGLEEVFNDLIVYYVKSREDLINAGNQFASELIIHSSNANHCHLRYKAFVLDLDLLSDSIVVSAKKVDTLDVSSGRIEHLQGESMDTIRYKYGQPQSDLADAPFDNDIADAYLGIFSNYIYNNL